MAYERIEPFGTLHDELMAGQICAVTANVHRDPKRHPEPWKPSDFGPSLKRHMGQSEAILLDDAEAQSALLANSLFGGLTKRAAHGQDDGRSQ